MKSNSSGTTMTTNKTIEISYWVQRSAVDDDPPNNGWINMSEPQPQRGKVHKFARRFRATLNAENQHDIRIRVCRLEVTIDGEF